MSIQYHSCTNILIKNGMLDLFENELVLFSQCSKCPSALSAKSLLSLPAYLTL